jgi:hypothetical protein
MAALIPSASATGSGTMTLAGPSTNSNQTITIPDTTGTMMVSGNMPAFRAYAASNNVSLSAGTSTKVLFDTEVFDTNNNFASSRFTPTVAGYYQVSSGVGGGSSSYAMAFDFYKNGSRDSRCFNSGANTVGFVGGSALIYCNGSTDYIEVYIYTSGAQTVGGNSSDVWFAGALIRSA